MTARRDVYSILYTEEARGEHAGVPAQAGAAYGGGKLDSEGTYHHQAA